MSKSIMLNKTIHVELNDIETSYDDDSYPIDVNGNTVYINVSGTTYTSVDEDIEQEVEVCIFAIECECGRTLDFEIETTDDEELLLKAKKHKCGGGNV